MPLFSIEEPSQPGEPYLISAEFRNSEGRVYAAIVKNEWIAHSGKWDVELVGPRLTIRESKGKISLKLLFQPGKGITVERLKMFSNGATVEIDAIGTIRINQGGMKIELANINASVGHSGIRGFVFDTGQRDSGL